MISWLNFWISKTMTMFSKNKCQTWEKKLMKKKKSNTLSSTQIMHIFIKTRNLNSIIIKIITKDDHLIKLLSIELHYSRVMWKNLFKKKSSWLKKKKNSNLSILLIWTTS
jgi:hypothetical protein